MDTDEAAPVGIDVNVPNAARMYDYYLGGRNNFPADREAAEKVLRVAPWIRATALENRAFLGRAVEFLAREQRMDQFVDIGTGLPTLGNVHEVAHRVAPDARIVYVDNDPLVLAHARALLTSSAEGSTDYIDADLNDPDALLRIARRKLDFSRPVAIMLMGVLAHIGNPAEDDDRVAQSIVGTLKAAMPSGGYLAIYDSADVNPKLNDALRGYNESGAAPYRVRRPEQIARFFDGLELVDPGVVPIPHPEVFAALKQKHGLLVDDGKIRLRTWAAKPDSAEAVVEVGGELKNKKGVNLPDTLLPVSAMTEKDRSDLAAALALGVDWAARAFVPRPLKKPRKRDSRTPHLGAQFLGPLVGRRAKGRSAGSSSPRSSTRGWS